MPIMTTSTASDQSHLNSGIQNISRPSLGGAMGEGLRRGIKDSEKMGVVGGEEWYSPASRELQRMRIRRLCHVSRSILNFQAANALPKTHKHGRQSWDDCGRELHCNTSLYSSNLTSAPPQFSNYTMDQENMRIMGGFPHLLPWCSFQIMFYWSLGSCHGTGSKHPVTKTTKLRFSLGSFFG